MDKNGKGIPIATVTTIEEYLGVSGKLTSNWEK
jgi:hypothetical protein